MKKLVFVVFLFFSVISVFSQEVIYQLKSNKVILSKVKFDSISKIYNDQLKYVMKMEDGKQLVIIDIEGSRKNSKQSASIKKNKKSKSLSSQKKQYKDVNGKTIGKDEFENLAKSEKYKVKYELTQNKDQYDIIYFLEYINEFEKAGRIYEKRFIDNLINTKFPSFDLIDISGNEISSKNLRGKIVVFNFWFISCIPCVKEIPLLNALVDKYKNNSDIAFLAPALDSNNQLSKFLNKNDFLYNIIPDSKEFRKNLNMSIYPTHIIIDKDGLIKDIILGFSENIATKLSDLINENLRQ